MSHLRLGNVGRYCVTKRQDSLIFFAFLLEGLFPVLKFDI